MVSQRVLNALHVELESARHALMQLLAQGVDTKQIDLSLSTKY
jgi:hypothetical protein